MELWEAPTLISHRDQINVSYPKKSSMHADQPEIMMLFNSISLAGYSRKMVIIQRMFVWKTYWLGQRNHVNS